jgi:hypothetical protein
MKVQPITQKAKGSPFKLNLALVEGAADLGATKDIYQKKEKEKETEPSPGNNQQPSNPPPPDLTDQGSKNENKTNEEVKKENNIVEEYKPNDVVGFFNNLFKKQ